MSAMSFKQQQEVARIIVDKFVRSFPQVMAKMFESWGFDDRVDQINEWRAIVSNELDSVNITHTFDDDHDPSHFTSGREDALEKRQVANESRAYLAGYALGAEQRKKQERRGNESSRRRR
jgi:hypothetical protein